MKPCFLSLLSALALGLVLTPAISLADYQPAAAALRKLESIVTLTSAQEKKALQIFQDLKDVMDSMTPAERPVKGAQSRQDALAAIRAILTPEQQAIYDRTPQRLGGGAKGDPVMQALNLKIRNFVTDFAKTSPQIITEVGTVQKVVVLANRSSTKSNGDSPDPNAHPQSGSNVVTVTGSASTKNFKISWEMAASEEMTVTNIESAEK